MDRCRVLILYTNRLFAEGVESILGREPWLEVVGMEECSERALAFIHLFHPDVVVIDANERLKCAVTIFPILQANPAIRVISLSMADNNIEVYHRHQILATKREDLVEAIQMA